MAKYPSIGQMQSSIRILHETTVDGQKNRLGHASPTTAKVLFKRVKAAVIPKGVGIETRFAQKLESRNFFMVTVRFLSGLQTSFDIEQDITLPDGTKTVRKLEILRIDDRDDKHRWQDIFCVERGDD